MTSIAVSLRPETDDDAGLLEALLADARALETELFPEGLRAAFVRQQLGVRERAWLASWPGARREVVLVDGAPAGRILVDCSGECVHLIDIALLPEHRGAGVGSGLLARVVAEADGRNAECELSVDRGNPARRLYERLGFVEVDADEVRVRMRRPTAQAKAAS